MKKQFNGKRPRRFVSAMRAREDVRRIEILEKRLEALSNYHWRLLAKLDRRDEGLDPRAVRLGNFGLRILKRVNRGLAGLPAKLYRLLKAPAVLAKPTPARQPTPYFSVILPVYNHADYLVACLESIRSQTFKDFECIVYDDASPDPRVRAILERYASLPGFRVVLAERNAGISRATNEAIALATGRYLAFVDCDDLLRDDALAQMAAFFSAHPDVGFAYSDREDITPDGKSIETISFHRNSAIEPMQELLIGMYMSHLKVVSAEALRRSGLFNPAFDSVQDYDMAFRLAETTAVGHVPHAIYRHRRHEQQTTVSYGERGERLADEVRAQAMLRQEIRDGRLDELVSIIILSMNRVPDTLRCLSSIHSRTRTPFEVIVIDNGSDATSLRELEAGLVQFPSVQLVKNAENLGCGGGRNQGGSLARGKYVMFLDNDIEVTDGWLENLLFTLKTHPGAAATCCRVVFPDQTLQFNGASYVKNGNRIKFALIDGGKHESDLSTLFVHSCDWVPGGATLIRKEVFDRFPYDTAIGGAFEDNDWSLMVTRAGFTLLNTPTAKVIHHHLNYSDHAKRDELYLSRRYDRAKIQKTLLNFTQKHGLTIEDDELYKFVGYENTADFEARAAVSTAAP